MKEGGRERERARKRLRVNKEVGNRPFGRLQAACNYHFLSIKTFRCAPAMAQAAEEWREGGREGGVEEEKRSGEAISTRHRAQYTLPELRSA